MENFIASIRLQVKSEVRGAVKEFGRPAEMPHLMPHVHKWARTLSVVVAAVSVLLSSFVVKTVFGSLWRGKLGKAAGPILKMVGWISLFDLLYTAKFLLTFASTRIFVDTPGWCTVMAFVGQSCAAGTTSLNFCVALDVLLIQRDPFRHKSSLFVPRYIAFCLSVALVSATAMLLADAYGVAYDATCWIVVPGLQLVFWVPLVCYMAFCSAVLVLFWVNRKKKLTAGGATSRRGTRGRSPSMTQTPVDPKIVARMAVFTLAFVLTWTPEMILFISSRLGRPSSFMLDSVNAVFMSALGSINFFVWRKQLAAVAQQQGAGSGGRAASEGCWRCSALCRAMVPCWRGARPPSVSDDDRGSEMAHVRLHDTEQRGSELSESAGQNPGAPAVTVEMDRLSHSVEISS